MSDNHNKIQEDIKQYEIASRILAIAGQNLTIEQALDEWETEHGAMLNLFDENQAYRIRNRKLLLALTLAEKALAAVENDAAMFITPKTRKTIEQFRELDRQIQAVKSGSVELNQNSDE